jgi:regulator of telomere elongation helicase 1
MRSCVSLWKSHGTPTIWERICAAKHAVVEPSNKAEFHQAFGDFNAALGLQTGRLDGKFVDPEDGAVARTGEVARHKGGAVFFAVCRGKVSEGIDFPDKAGRAVILTGTAVGRFPNPGTLFQAPFVTSTSH